MTLFNYVSGFRVEKGVDHTHTSFARPSGSFYVPGSESARFVELYKVAMARGEDLHFTERHRHIGPVVIDIDERYEPSGASDEPRRRHNDDVIDKVVLVYARQLAEFVETPVTFDMYVTEKPSATMLKGLVKDGLHIMIPDVVTRPAVQLLLRQATLPQLADAMGPLGLANRIEEVVDEAVIERNNWMMYGSRKPHAEAYDVTRRYRYDTRTGGVERVALDAGADYVELFSIRNKNHECAVRPERVEVVSTFIAQQDDKRRRREAVQAVVGSSVNARGNTCDNLPEVERLVDLLDPARAESYNEWVRTGWCLRNIDHRLLESWVQFSKKSSKYMEGECPRLWHYMRQGGLGIGTLHMWARMDSPDRYRTLLRSDLSDLLLRSANTGTHNDVACVVHHMYRYDYVCASLRNRTWYEFRDHRWRESDSACSLRKRLCIEVFKEYGEMAKQVQQRAIDATDEGEQQRLVETCQKLNGIALQLKKTYFKDNVIKECSELFHVEKFEELLDSDCNLVGFENGTYDLERHEFREGRPDDHVSFSTGINYVPYAGDNHPTIAEIRRFWEQIHPDPDIRSYVMRTLADCLSGHITHERFNIWTGSGCHAPGTKIMMYNGSVKNVEDVLVGDRLMGDDSKPRNVLQLFQGRADMWRVVPTKGEPFIVNGDHVLSLKMTNVTSVFFRNNRPNLPWMARWRERDDKTVICAQSKCFATELDAYAHVRTQETSNLRYVKKGDVIDLTVKSYLENVRNIGERNSFLYRPEFVEFPSVELPAALDPYVLGVWLGDGSGRWSQITSMDDPLVDKVRELLPATVQMNAGTQKGKATSYNISKAAGVGRKLDKNDVVIALDHYGLLQNKHIPLDYRCNTREVRLKVLAGILDTDGYYQAHCNQFQLTLKVERLIDDTVALARSLGFACYKRAVRKTCCNNGKVGTYYTVNIVGEGIEDIPTVLERKRARMRVKVKDVRCVGFKLERVDDGGFFGFELDGNHRYLMGDYVVTHNSNGKSLSVALFEKSFGDYCCKFPVTLLTGKRAASNAASGEIARAKGRRFAVLQEPSEDEHLNIGLMKELSGGDKIQCRELYKSPVEWRPQFKLFLLCNHLPSVPSDDGGTWRRIRVVEFGSKFVQHPTRENEFPMDTELPQKLEGWREHFMAMLIEYRRRFVHTKLEEPEAVLACTREYQRNNDHMADFVDSCMELVPEQTVLLTLDDAFHEFKEWARADCVPVRNFKKRDLQSYMDRNVARSAKVGGRLCYRGYRIRDRFAAGSDEQVDELE
jgi:P4 family phage/plasmid primase-like protien